MEQPANTLNASELMAQILEVRFTDPDQMQTLCHRLLASCEVTGDVYGTAFANLYLLDYAQTMGDFDACRFYLLRAQPMCEENRYYNLLITLHIVAGMYFQDIFDEQSALKHYFQGLEICEMLNAASMASKLLNNIGICFSRRNADADAAHYFSLAYETMEPHIAGLSPSDLGNTVSFLCNLAEACQGLGKIEESKNAILKAEALNVRAKLWDLWLCYAWCGHYTICGDKARSTEYAEKLLADGLAELDNAYFKTSTLIEVCGCMLKMENQELALRYLKLLESCCGPDNVGDYYNCQVLKTRYYQQFGTDAEQRLAYRMFYEVSVKINEADNHMRVNSQLSKIELTDALSKHKAMRKKNRELEDASHMDALTWLFNRRYVSKLLSKLALEKSTVSMGCIILDVDYFKQFNDHYGHFQGDEALRCVADILRQNASPGVYPSRYGGDEFLILCVNWTNDDMESLIIHIQNDLASKNMRHEKSLCSEFLTLSIGYSNGDVQEVFFENLLNQADKALYAAKSKGRNQFVAAHKIEE